MREVTVIFGLDKIERLEEKNIGFTGEHNSTMLNLVLPDAIIAEFEHYIINFDTGTKKFLSSVITKDTEEYGAWIDDNVLKCILWNELLEHRYLSLTVDCIRYGENGELVELRKLPMLKSLHLEPSIESNVIPSKTCKGIITQLSLISKFLSEQINLKDEVSENSAARHTHPNKYVIDALTSVDGKLLYNGREIGGNDGRVDGLVEAVNAIEEIIPESASLENPLATESYVNDSVSTNTAYFRGSFNSVEELEAYAGDVTNNDYAYVIIRDEDDPSIVKSIIRYKYAINQWLYEFELSLHDLTPAQIAALLSGITAEKVSTYDEVVSNVDGYSSQNGIPTFNGDNIALEKVDDVTPLPFDEPINLVFREDCREVAFPVVQDCGAVFNASAYIDSANRQLFNVYAGNGEFVVTATYGPDNFDRTTDGINWADENGNTVQRPTLPGTTIRYITFNDEDGVPMYTVSATDPIESQPENIQLAFHQLCQVVNVSADAMGTIGNADFVEAFKGEIEYNRSYALHLTGDEATFELPVNRWDLPDVPDGYAVVYLTIDQDMDFGFDADYFVGGEVPSTTAGVHKLIYNFLPNQQISLGGLDLEAVM